MATYPINKTLINAPAADVALTSTMSGMIFICTPAAGAARQVLLPAPTNPGLKYTFIHSNTVAQAITIAHGGGGQLRGYYNNDGTFTATGANTISFTATAVPVIPSR